MTINKSQGQTFDRCGLLLDGAQCFSHGQLYVACSRVTSHDSLFVFTGYEKVGDSYEFKTAKNCVYKELFSTDSDKPSYNKNSCLTFVDTPDEEKEIGEEEPDHSITVLPKDTFNKSEEEVVNMIMPEELYTVDYSKDISLGDIEERLDDFEDKLEQNNMNIEEKLEQNNKNIEEKLEQTNKNIDKNSKNVEELKEIILNFVKRMSEEEGSDTDDLPKKKRIKLH